MKFIHKLLVIVIDCYAAEPLDFDQFDYRLEKVYSIWLYGIEQDSECFQKIIKQVNDQKLKKYSLLILNDLIHKERNYYDKSVQFLYLF